MTTDDAEDFPCGWQQLDHLTSETEAPQGAWPSEATPVFAVCDVGLTLVGSIPACPTPTPEETQP